MFQDEKRVWRVFAIEFFTDFKIVRIDVTTPKIFIRNILIKPIMFMIFTDILSCLSSLIYSLISRRFWLSAFIISISNPLFSFVLYKRLTAVHTT